LVNSLIAGVKWPISLTDLREGEVECKRDIANYGLLLASGHQILDCCHKRVHRFIKLLASTCIPSCRIRDLTKCPVGNVILRIENQKPQLETLLKHEANFKHNICVGGS
jgi:hypothetical protein